MLTKLQIWGFGANERADIEIGPHVTTIVGKSFEGKSWILRALKWVTMNRPTGDSFINWNCDRAKVRLHVDGRKVLRKRGGDENTYKLGGKEFVAFGNSVPLDINRMLNLSDINYQNQMEKPFWFCETAGEVSRQLNSIIDLEIIDSTLAEIASKLRIANTAKDISAKNLEELVKNKKGMAFVAEMDGDLTDIEATNAKHEGIAEKSRRIDDLIKSVGLYASEQENAADRASGARIAMSAGERYCKITKSMESLTELIESTQKQQKVLDSRPPSIEPLERLLNDLGDTGSTCYLLNFVIEKAEEYEEEKCRTERELERCKKEFKRIVGNTCPICGKPMKS